MFFSYPILEAIIPYLDTRSCCTFCLVSKQFNDATESFWIDRAKNKLGFIVDGRSNILINTIARFRDVYYRGLPGAKMRPYISFCMEYAGSKRDLETIKRLQSEGSDLGRAFFGAGRNSDVEFVNKLISLTNGHLGYKYASEGAIASGNFHLSLQFAVLSPIRMVEIAIMYDKLHILNDILNIIDVNIPASRSLEFYLKGVCCRIGSMLYERGHYREAIMYGHKSNEVDTLIESIVENKEEFYVDIVDYINECYFPPFDDMQLIVECTVVNERMHMLGQIIDVLIKFGYTEEIRRLTIVAHTKCLRERKFELIGKLPTLEDCNSPLLIKAIINTLDRDMVEWIFNQRGVDRDSVLRILEKSHPDMHNYFVGLVDDMT